ncbi:hypothetical protein K474DRAFT_1655951 [Panus rudis PR-1116 ss-1]|nr:hypothetical protein K474DRAFT_1655951 [Panus rudis PR-1116 ss-1]
MPQTTAVIQDVPLTEFLNTIPSPLVSVLVGLGPYISRIRHVIEVVSWKSSWGESWLTLGLWWATCLLSDIALRYVLPIAMLVVLFVARWTYKPQAAPPPVTEDNLQQSISDLTVIHNLLPRSTLFKSPSNDALNLKVILRVLTILYIPYLILTYFVRLRILIAVAGTILLTWRARWAALIRRGFWRSAWIRWGCYYAWSYLSGQPLPPKTISPQSQSVSVSSNSSKDGKSGNSIRFLFTIYENQRWWMGLDWTAALLPGERPSWCTASQQPVAPPNAFSLPAPTTVYMREGNKRVKRTARWKWEEPEWRVIVHKEGSSISRVQRPVPSPPEEGTTASSMIKAAGKMRQASISGPPESGGNEQEQEKSGENGKGHGNEEDIYTDPDGWVYGDNKWEKCSSKGGRGKYTRYRRWTRIAVLSETVEVVEDGETGIRREDGQSTNAQTSQTQQTKAVHFAPTPAVSSSSSTTAEVQVGVESKLRQRLQAAVKGGAGH